MQRELLGGVLLLRGFWSPVLRGHEDTGQGQQESPLLCCKATEVFQFGGFTKANNSFTAQNCSNFRNAHFIRYSTTPSLKE